jgi:hypothetical protein
MNTNTLFYRFLFALGILLAVLWLASCTVTVNPETLERSYALDGKAVAEILNRKIGSENIQIEVTK